MLLRANNVVSVLLSQQMLCLNNVVLVMSQHRKNRHPWSILMTWVCFSYAIQMFHNLEQEHQQRDNDDDDHNNNNKQ